jgi:hypothetical protein
MIFIIQNQSGLEAAMRFPSSPLLVAFSFLLAVSVPTLGHGFATHHDYTPYGHWIDSHFTEDDLMVALTTYQFLDQEYVVSLGEASGLSIFRPRVDGMELLGGRDLPGVEVKACFDGAVGYVAADPAG